MKVAVIGAGYVGLTTAVCLAERGHEVVIAEQDQARLDMIVAGKTPFFEPLVDDLLRQSLDNGKLAVVSSIEEALVNAEFSFVAVGTPFKGDAIDLSYVTAACSAIGKTLAGRRVNKVNQDKQDNQQYHVVVIKSTVVPGTTDEVVAEIERCSGLKNSEFGVCMNPEFLREGTAVTDFREPDRIIIGSFDERAGRVLASLYKDFDCPILHTTLRNAELTKYASNALLSLLVSFSNELAGLCEILPDTDVDVVMNGLHLDKRLSPIVNGERVSPNILSYLRAGCGFGGSCLPKDVNALRGFARALGVKLPLMDATIEVNEARPHQVIKLLEAAIGTLEGKDIAVLGLAFKPNTDDVRESPSLKFVAALLERRCRVRVFDPLVSGSFLQSDENVVACCESVAQAATGADALIIATAWQEFKSVDWAQVSSKMKQPVVIDGRRLLSSVNLPPNMVYHPIGTRDSIKPSQILVEAHEQK